MGFRPCVAGPLYVEALRGVKVHAQAILGGIAGLFSGGRQCTNVIPTRAISGCPVLLDENLVRILSKLTSLDLRTQRGRWEKTSCEPFTLTAQGTGRACKIL